MAALAQHAEHELLVDLVVFGDEHAKRTCAARSRSVLRAAARPLVRPPTGSSTVRDGVEQLRVRDRLGDVAADAQLAAARGVAQLAGRGAAS